jgi:hypothetical protein
MFVVRGEEGDVDIGPLEPFDWSKMLSCCQSLPTCKVVKDAAVRVDGVIPSDTETKQEDSQ